MFLFDEDSATEVPEFRGIVQKTQVGDASTLSNLESGVAMQTENITRAGMNVSFTAEPKATDEPGKAVAFGSAVNESSASFLPAGSISVAERLSCAGVSLRDSLNPKTKP